MKTKLNKVYGEVKKAVGNEMTGMEIAEVAEYLLRKAKGDVKLAMEMAKRPYNVANWISY